MIDNVELPAECVESQFGFTRPPAPTRAGKDAPTPTRRLAAIASPDENAQARPAGARPAGSRPGGASRPAGTHRPLR